MEDAAGRAAGYSGAFGMGNLQWAYLHCLLREWLAGTDGRIVKVQCQFRLASEQHHTVTAKGVVTGVREEDGEQLVDLDVWTEIEDGTKLAPGSATVAFPLTRTGVNTPRHTRSVTQVAWCQASGSPGHVSVLNA